MRTLTFLVRTLIVRNFPVALFTGCFDGSVMVVTRFWRHAFQRGGNQENGDKEEEVDDGIGDLNTDEKDHCLHLKGSVTEMISSVVERTPHT